MTPGRLAAIGLRFAVVALVVAAGPLAWLPLPLSGSVDTGPAVARADDPPGDVTLGNDEVPVVTTQEGFSLALGSYPSTITYNNTDSERLVWTDTGVTSTFQSTNLTVPAEGGGGWYINYRSDLNVNVVVEGYDTAAGAWVTVDDRTLQTGGLGVLQVRVRDATTSSGRQYDEFDTLRFRVTNTQTDVSGTLELYALGALADTTAPTGVFTSPSNGSTVDDAVTASVDVSDADFAASYGESIDVTLRADGQVVDNATVTANGSVVLNGPVPPGRLALTVELDDANGDTVTVAGPTVLAPGFLNVTVLNDDGTVNDYTDPVTVRLEPFGDVTDTVELNGDGGNVSFAGINRSRQYVATVTPDDGAGSEPRTRRVLLTTDDLLDSREAVLLRSGSSVVETRFLLDDVSGEFPAGETRVRLFRVVTIEGNTEYRPVAGGFFGASESFALDLEEGARYRIRVAYADERRELGAYVATSPREVPLTIGQLTWEVDKQRDLLYAARFYNLSSVNPAPFGYVNFEFTDAEARTQSLRVVVHERGNASNEVWNTTYTGPLGNVSVNATVEGDEVTNTTWVVDWRAVRSTGNGSTAVVTNTIPVSGQRFPVPNPFDGKWLPVFVSGLLVVFAFTFLGSLATVGALVTSAVAGVLWWAGLYPASGGVVVLAALVAAVSSIGRGGRR